MTQVRLGIDLAELPSEPETLYRAAQLAYLAGGGHAGDVDTLDRALARCVAHRVIVGAHPGYPDRPRFGRFVLEMHPDDLRATVRTQCALVRERAARVGVSVTVLKLHGALYHHADREPAVARACLDGALDALGADITLVALDHGGTARQARARGWSVLREGFADRATRADGSLVPRGEPGAVLTDPERVSAHVASLLATGGHDVLCVHGDGEEAPRIAATVRATLAQWSART